MSNFSTRFLVTETNVDKINNTSTVKVEFQFCCTSRVWHGWNRYTNQSYFILTVNGDTTGKVYFKFDWTLGMNQWKTIGTKTVKIKHNPDGNKSIDLYGYVSFDIDDPNYPLSKSETRSLTRIDRGASYLDDGTGLKPYQLYIDNGNGWDVYAPYVDDGTSWSMLT